MGLAEIDGGKLYYEVGGRGHPLVFMVALYIVRCGMINRIFFRSYRVIRKYRKRYMRKAVYECIGYFIHLSKSITEEFLGKELSIRNSEDSILITPERLPTDTEPIGDSTTLKHQPISEDEKSDST